MYRVMTDFGSGNDRKVQLTDLAWRYLVDQRPDKRQPLLREMVLSPDIMSEMWSEWGATPPGDSECHIQLVLDRGFTESAATDFLAIYKDNVAFAQLVEEQVVNSELPSTPASSEVWPSSAPPTSSVFPASVVASPTVQPTTATDAPGVVWREERLLDDQGEEILIRYKGEPTADRYAFIRDYLDFKLRRMKPSGS